MDETHGVQLFANLDDWKCVKKLKVEKGMESREIAEFLISLCFSANKKAEDFLSKDIDFEIIKKAVDSEDLKPQNVLESNSVKRAIKESIKNRESLESNVVKTMEEIASIFATRYLLKKSGIKIDYYEAELPSLKLAKKLSKKVK
ncbi:MAG: DUF2666 family protein [Candidatus Diapherotrites archaeon]